MPGKRTELLAMMRLVIAACIVFALGMGQARADLLINANGQGWINNGNHGSNGDFNYNNYIVGNCGAGNCEAGEYRDHFEFLIPSLAGLNVVSADLVLNTFSAALDQSPSLDYQVTSLAAGADFNNLATFNLLGTGTFYGMRTYTAADGNLVEDITLNAAALSDIVAAQGGLFAVGGRVTSPTTFSPNAPDQAVFGFSGFAQELKIVTAVPEPGYIWLFLTVLLSCATLSRKPTF